MYARVYNLLCIISKIYRDALIVLPAVVATAAKSGGIAIPLPHGGMISTTRRCLTY